MQCERNCAGDFPDGFARFLSVPSTLVFSVADLTHTFFPSCPLGAHDSVCTFGEKLCSLFAQGKFGCTQNTDCFHTNTVREGSSVDDIESGQRFPFDIRSTAMRPFSGKLFDLYGQANNAKRCQSAEQRTSHYAVQMFMCEDRTQKEHRRRQFLQLPFQAFSRWLRPFS